MSVGDKLRKIVFCLFLAVSIPALGGGMSPEEIQELLDVMNRVRVEFVMPAEGTQSDRLSQVEFPMPGAEEQTNRS
jgi:hypothetical protein